MLLGAFRGEDQVGRWGGEEFVVGMYGWRAVTACSAWRKCSRASRAGESPSTRAMGMTELLRAADEALYRAKATGRNRVLPAG